MKQKFSIKWLGSRQIRKQRKFRANAPLHIKSKLLSAHLNKELRKKYGKRSFPLRKDDEVKIMRGKFKGKSGKVILVDRKKQRVAIEGIQKSKKDGTKINVYFNSSNLLIKNLALEDKKRVHTLNRKIPKRKEFEKKEIVKKTTKSNLGKEQDAFEKSSS